MEKVLRAPVVLLLEVQIGVAEPDWSAVRNLNRGSWSSTWHGRCFPIVYGVAL